jgi:hypothetical protein
MVVAAGKSANNRHLPQPMEGVSMTTIRQVNYCYVMTPDKPGAAATILSALRDSSVNLLVFSGFPAGRGKAQIDLVTDDLESLKALAKQQKWKLSRTKRAFLAQGVGERGAAIAPLATLATAKINITAATAIAAGEGRFGMIFWVKPAQHKRAAQLLVAS